ncbi:MAG: hypothetical protein Q9227_009140 [Pyrenula ochraceoflavens]
MSIPYCHSPDYPLPRTYRHLDDNTVYTVPYKPKIPKSKTPKPKTPKERRISKHLKFPEVYAANISKDLFEPESRPTGSMNARSAIDAAQAQNRPTSSPAPKSRNDSINMSVPSDPQPPPASTGVSKLQRAKARMTSGTKKIRDRKAAAAAAAPVIASEEPKTSADLDPDLKPNPYSDQPPFQNTPPPPPKNFEISPPQTLKPALPPRPTFTPTPTDKPTSSARPSTSTSSASTSLSTLSTASRTAKPALSVLATAANPAITLSSTSTPSAPPNQPSILASSRQYLAFKKSQSLLRTAEKDAFFYTCITEPDSDNEMVVPRTPVTENTTLWEQEEKAGYYRVVQEAYYRVRGEWVEWVLGGGVREERGGGKW